MSTSLSKNHVIHSWLAEMREQHWLRAIEHRHAQKFKYRTTKAVALRNAEDARAEATTCALMALREAFRHKDMDTAAHILNEFKALPPLPDESRLLAKLEQQSRSASNHA